MNTTPDMDMNTNTDMGSHEPGPSTTPVAGKAMPVITIRRADPGDIRPLSVLMTQLGYETREDEAALRLRRMLPREECLVAVALAEGAVVGVVSAVVFFALEKNCRHGVVSALSVLAEHRCRGIGALLLRHAEEWMRAWGVEVCAVNSSNYRTRAHDFYRREGYAGSGVRFQKRLIS